MGREQEIVWPAAMPSCRDIALEDLWYRKRHLTMLLNLFNCSAVAMANFSRSDKNFIMLKCLFVERKTKANAVIHRRQHEGKEPDGIMFWPCSSNHFFSIRGTI